MDIRPGPAGSAPLSLVAIGDQLFFTADDGSVGRELWVTDGTLSGTRRLTEVNLGSESRFPDGLTAVGGMLLFFVQASSADRLELWKSDGSAPGTLRVKRFFKDAYLMGEVLDSPQVAFGGRLYFHMEQCAFNVCEGRGMWVSDGTAAGTKHFFSAPGWNTFGPIAAAGSKLFWHDGRRLLRTNGTPSSSKVMGQMQVTKLAPVGNSMFFHSHTFDGDPANDGLGVSHGTAATTLLLAELESVNELTPLGSLLLFVSGTHLMVSDGTPIGTHVQNTDSDLGTLSNVGGLVYFHMAGSLWATDGTAGSGFEVYENVHGGPMTDVDGTGYFVSPGPLDDKELWRFVP